MQVSSKQYCMGAARLGQAAAPRGHGGSKADEDWCSSELYRFINFFSVCLEKVESVS